MLFFAQKQYKRSACSLFLAIQKFLIHQIKQALLMQDMLIAVAQNGSLDESVYSSIRREFMNSDAESLLPEIIKTCRDQENVWRYLKKSIVRKWFMG